MKRKNSDDCKPWKHQHKKSLGVVPHLPLVLFLRNKCIVSNKTYQVINVISLYVYINNIVVFQLIKTVVVRVTVKEPKWQINRNKDAARCVQ